MGHQFEGLLSDIDRYGDQLQFRRQLENLQAQYQSELEARSVRYEKVSTALAGQYALREALIGQLRKFDPKNPLIEDQDLQQRVKTAAAQALFNNLDPDGAINFERAREVGRTFKIPGR
jgi:hypothetical protein